MAIAKKKTLFDGRSRGRAMAASGREGRFSEVSGKRNSAVRSESRCTAKMPLSSSAPMSSIASTPVTGAISSRLLPHPFGKGEIDR